MGGILNVAFERHKFCSKLDYTSLEFVLVGAVGLAEDFSRRSMFWLCNLSP